MSTPFVGEIQAFPFDWASEGFNNTWLPCFGQVVPIQKFVSLFSLIGSVYGGNGTTNFALPNLNGSVVIGQGNGAGLEPRFIGEQIGTPLVSLVMATMVQHTHGLQLGSKAAANAAPGPGRPGTMAAIDPNSAGFVAPPPTTAMSPSAVSFVGDNQPHNNMQPHLALVWCIAFAGIFPAFTS